jgi:hypothetical protein
MDTQHDAKLVSADAADITSAAPSSTDDRLAEIEEGLDQVSGQVKKLADLVTNGAVKCNAPAAPVQPVHKWLKDLWAAVMRNPKTTAVGVGCLALAIDLCRKGQIEAAVLSFLAGIGKIIAADGAAHTADSPDSLEK